MQKNAVYSLRVTFIFILLFSVFSQVLHAQRTLGLDKSGKKKRIHFYEGQRLKVKLITNEKVGGTLDAIYDSSFVIEGRKISLNEVATVYSERGVFKYLGGAFMAGGALYLGIDVVNNLINYNSREYVISQNTLLYSGTAIAVGGVLFYFGTRRTQVYGKNTFRVFNTTPIPIIDSSDVSTGNYCENGVEAVLTKLDLDGCNWVLLLPTGEKLEPMNIYDYLSDEQMEKGEPLKVRVEYYETKSASICMVGKTVAISCWEVLK